MTTSQDKNIPEDRFEAARKSYTYYAYNFPYWLFALFVAWVLIALLIYTDPLFTGIFNRLKDGIGMTLQVSFVGYICALSIGLIVGLIRSSTPTPPKHGANLVEVALSVVRLIIYNLATLYIQVLRGLPMVVVLLLGAFTVVPILESVLRTLLFSTEFRIRGASAETAVIALAFAYGAFLSETFRAGIQSIDKGQVEAARSLGMTYYQTMRYVVLPQAVRRILPPLGNDMISMIKDSSLVSFLGVNDITQIARTSVGRSFRYTETYLVLAVIYLTMTVIGSLLVRYLERRLKQNER